MTESEAKEIVRKEKAYMDSHAGRVQSEAFQMAINALEKQEKIKEAFEKWRTESGGYIYADDYATELIRTLNQILRSDEAIEIVKQGDVYDDVCEWESDCHLENDNPAEWLISPHNPKRIFSTDIIYCPYCGKKIKVVE